MATSTIHTSSSTVMSQPVMMAPPPVIVTQTTTSGGNSMREAIPSFPMPIAVLLAIINFFLPGIGTIIAGFGVLCCGNTGQSGGGRFGTFCINFWVGILQLLLAPLIVGWVWSWIWGYAFMASSAGDDPTTTTTTTVVGGGGVVAPQPMVSTVSTTHVA